MHKPVLIQNLTPRENDSPVRKEKISHSSPQNESINTLTLSLINQALAYRKYLNSINQITLKQIFSKWQLALALEETRPQVSSALLHAMKSWIDIQTSADEALQERQQKVQMLFKHIRSTAHFFNTESHKQCISILHFMMLHPIQNIDLNLMQQQADLYHEISAQYRDLHGSPNYHKLSQRLFIRNDENTTLVPLYFEFILGIVTGFVLSSLLKLSVFGICSI